MLAKKFPFISFVGFTATNIPQRCPVGTLLIMLSFPHQPEMPTVTILPHNGYYAAHFLSSILQKHQNQPFLSHHPPYK